MVTYIPLPVASRAGVSAMEIKDPWSMDNEATRSSHHRDHHSMMLGLSGESPQDVDVAVGARVGGEDVVVWDDDDALFVPHLDGSVGEGGLRPQ